VVFSKIPRYSTQELRKERYGELMNGLMKSLLTEKAERENHE